MTDKELRKLSRLELLELLLEASRENKKLKEQIEKLKAENKTSENIENLYVITGQVENALRYANNITDTLRPVSGAAALADNIKNTNDINKPYRKAEPMSDVELYKRMLRFFAKNDDKLSVFPADVENDIRARIKSILERKKSN